MGMFDQYEPHPRVVCPYCGTELKQWQGKDGPCAALVWRQGMAAPIEQMAEQPLSKEKLALFHLPAKFTFYNVRAGCHFCPREAVGHVTNGVWDSSVFVVPSDAPFHEVVDMENVSSSHAWGRSTGQK